MSVDVGKLQVAILLFFGLFYVFITPPFKAPDEISHLLRAYSVAEGQWIMKDHPSALIRFYLVEAEQRHEMTPALRVSLHRLLAHYGDRVPNLAFNSSLYSPVSYLLHAMVIKVFMLFGQPNFLILLYFLRLCSLLIFMGLLFLSFKLFPPGAWPIFWVAVTPMALSQASVINLDYLIFGSTAVMLSAGLGNEGVRCYSLCMISALIVLMNTKLPYLPLLLVPVAAVIIRKDNERIYSLLMGICLALAGGLFWNYLLKAEGIFENSLDIAKNVFQLTIHLDPVQQLYFIVFSPWQYVKVLFTTCSAYGFTVFHQFVGVLGELDVPLSSVVVWLWTMGALLMVLFISGAESRFKRRDSIIMGICCIIAALSTALAVMTSAFLVWMPVGSVWINVQGRYFHAIMVVLLTGLILINPLNILRRLSCLLQFSLLFLAVVIQCISVYTMILL